MVFLTMKPAVGLSSLASQPLLMKALLAGPWGGESGSAPLWTFLGKRRRSSSSPPPHGVESRVPGPVDLDLLSSNEKEKLLSGNFLATDV